MPILRFLTLSYWKRRRELLQQRRRNRLLREYARYYDHLYHHVSIDLLDALRAFHRGLPCPEVVKQAIKFYTYNPIVKVPE